jgi:hypothetical protein
MLCERSLTTPAAIPKANALKMFAVVQAVNTSAREPEESSSR